MLNSVDSTFTHHDNFKHHIWQILRELVHLALFPGSTQLSVTCSMEKQGEPGISSHVSMT